jgi:para-nitrobenzyl esterase
MMALGAVAAALPGVAAAQAREEFPNKGKAAVGPGIPVPTAVVKTRSGPVQGLVEDKIHTFRGIRYGKAPVGRLRFMPPQPPEPWATPADCTAFGPPAMQMASGATALTTSDFGLQMHRVFSTPSDMKVQNEDCLYLNVWSPGTDARKRPVMVWIHGGGFAYGSGSDPVYQGDGLARHGDVVVVSVNHRLNAFGYAYLGDLMGPEYATSGTVGMQDLVLALKWVHDNIEGFGGDPGNVMIMGQSGGGMKVSTLMAMPSARGLFHKAAIQSGPGLALGRKEAANDTAKKLLDLLGVKPGDRAALEALPAQTILEAAYKVGRGFSPIVDAAIPRDPFTPDAPSISADVPILVGWAKDEWTIFSTSEPWYGTMTEAELQARVKPMGERGQKLLAAIKKEFPTYSPTFQWIQMISVRMMQGSETLAERKAAQGKAPAYVYTVSWETPVAGGLYKSPHTIEIPFMLYNFDRMRQFVGTGPGPKRMGDQIAGAWVSFARTGKPVVPGGPAWPPYNPQTRPVMDFNLTSKVVNDPYPAIRQALASGGPAPRG